MSRQIFNDGESLASVRSKINKILIDGQINIKGDNTVFFQGDWKLATVNDTPVVQIYQEATDDWTTYDLTEIAKLSTENSTDPTIIIEDTLHRFVTDTQIADWNAKSVNSDIVAAINALIDGAPDDLNTLNEIAASIGDDPDFSGTVNNAINTLSTSTTDALNLKADITYVDTEVSSALSNLVGAAPETLDTLGEIAAAIADDGSYAISVQNALDLKDDITSVDTKISSAIDNITVEDLPLEVVNTSAGVSDASKLIKTDSIGKIDNSFLKDDIPIMIDGKILLENIPDSEEEVWGVLPYSSSKNYAIFNKVIDEASGIIYECMIPNGLVSPVSPINDATGTWLYADRGRIGLTLTLDIEPDTTWLIQMGALAKEGQSLLDVDYPKLLAFYNTTVVGGPKPFGFIDASHFYLPDDRGKFERQWDNGAGIDPDVLTRGDRGDGTTGDNPGTTQLDAFQGHRVYEYVVDGSSAFKTLANGTNQGNISTPSSDPITDGVNGTPRTSSENRPINVAKWKGVIAR